MRRTFCASAITLVAALCVYVPSAHAQQNSDAADGGATLHLRTFVNRMQIPTLVLGAHRTPVTDLPAGAFSIRLDAGTAFHPTQLRMEGNDPIALAVLIDDAGSQPEIVAQLTDALPEFARLSLHEGDTISIFSADCKMFRTRMNVPADPADIRLGIQRALSAVQTRQDKKHRNCDASFHLLDYASWMFQQMGTLQGRRVALIISGGHEHGSQTVLPAVVRLAAHNAISVFGFRSEAEKSRDPRSLMDAFAGGSHNGDKEDLFDLLCATSGGIIFGENGRELRPELDSFIELLRTRYILEFPAPDHGVGGMHGMVVTVAGKRKVLVRASGASAALADPTLSADPNVVPTSASPAVFGPRRPLETNKH